MLPGMNETDPPYLRPKIFNQWYALDYFHRRGGWRLALWGLTALAVLLCLVWLVAAAALGHRRIYQSGPVALGHAAIAEHCRCCHTVPLQPARRLFAAGARSVPDSACAVCHAVEAVSPIHREQASDRACALCHREHRDRPNLARVPEGHCTTCHRDLHTADGQPSSLPNVSDFALDHPEFRALESKEGDPAQVHFNHERHLKRQGILGISGQWVHLHCQDCHQPDSARRLFQPVTYEAHCASCHPLSIQIAGQDFDPAISAAVAHFNKTPAPHKDPAVVREALRKRYAGFLEEHPAVLARPPMPEPDRAFPGKARPDRTLVTNRETWLAFQQQTAERVLFAGAGGCRYCHVPLPSGRPAETADLPVYARTGITTRWLPHGFFNHAAEGHRIDCTRCHAATTSSLTRDVLIPGLATCRGCHAPQGTGRADCAECHRYHLTGRAERLGERLALGQGLEGKLCCRAD